jgi:hypothetical protein
MKLCCSAIIQHEGKDYCQHGFILFPACYHAGDGDLSIQPYKVLPCCNEQLSLGRAGCDESGKPTFERWRERQKEKS